tara:strand:- start:33 stop:536 length:504 start_codon:yes stop_codon:yes gene_type:complete
MVHRIQNRNPGYSDFGNTGSAQSFNFSSTMNNPVSHGANALKLENEVLVEPETNTTSAHITDEQSTNTQETEIESIVENNQANDYEQSFAEEALNNMSETEETESIVSTQASNGLENFGVEEESAPDLFNSDSENTDSDAFPSTEMDQGNSEDDDLEIPAFLRRQKN